MTAGEWIGTLWVNPRRYPDFAFAWWSRFLITLATFMFTAFRLFYMQDRLGLSLERRAGCGLHRRADLHDRSGGGGLGCREDLRPYRSTEDSSWPGRRCCSRSAPSCWRSSIRLTGFYMVEAVLGLAYGIYVGVDLALVVDVLPNPDDAGKDLGRVQHGQRPAAERSSR